MTPRLLICVSFRFSSNEKAPAIKPQINKWAHRAGENKVSTLQILVNGDISQRRDISRPWHGTAALRRSIKKKSEEIFIVVTFMAALLLQDGRGGRRKGEKIQGGKCAVQVMSWFSTHSTRCSIRALHPREGRCCW